MATAADSVLPVTVPAPTPPTEGEAWYTTGVRAQREVFPGVVVTVRGDGATFRY